MQMSPKKIGSVTISKITEYVEPLDPQFVLKDFRPRAIEKNRDWLLPHFIDSATQFLIFSFHTLVISTDKHTILVDTCVGNDKDRPLEQWHMRRGDYLQNLAKCGVQPNDVDFVMCTHLHADHVGWNTRMRSGQWVPTFPNAKYVFSSIDYDFFNSVSHGQPGYQSMIDSVRPVVEAGQAAIVGYDFSINDEISLLSTPGHTPGHYCVKIHSGGQKAVLSGDLIHHPIQVAYPEWRTNFCQDPDLSCQTRKRFIDENTDTGTKVFAAHFAGPTVGYIESNKSSRYFKTSESPLLNR